MKKFDKINNYLSLLNSFLWFVIIIIIGFTIERLLISVLSFILFIETHE